MGFSQIKISSLVVYPSYDTSTFIFPITLIIVSFAAYSFYSGGHRMSRMLYPNLSRKFFPATDISAPVSGIAVTVFECILPFFLHTIFTYILGVFESN